MLMIQNTTKRIKAPLVKRIRQLLDVFVAPVSTLANGMDKLNLQQPEKVPTFCIQDFNEVLSGS